MPWLYEYSENISGDILDFFIVCLDPPWRTGVKLQTSRASIIYIFLTFLPLWFLISKTHLIQVICCKVGSGSWETSKMLAHKAWNQTPMRAIVLWNFFKCHFFSFVYFCCFSAHQHKNNSCNGSNLYSWDERKCVENELKADFQNKNKFWWNFYFSLLWKITKYFSKPKFSGKD